MKSSAQTQNNQKDTVEHQNVVPRQNLQRLLWMRWVMLAGLALGAGIAHYKLDIVFPEKIIFLAVFVFIIFAALTQYRLRYTTPLTEIEFSSHIFADIVGISIILYFLGGASNPFVSYYLVPLAIAAATLSWHYSLLLTFISFVAYSGLLFVYHPIEVLEPAAHGHLNHENLQASQLHPHTVGMWFNFLLSAGLISFFVVRMASALKERENQLSRLREENLRDEQVLAVATLAAGTAHELGTPLSTIKILAKELILEHGSNSELKKDLKKLDEQVIQCRDILKRLVNQSEISQRQEFKPEPVAEYCGRILEKWQLIRPDVETSIKIVETDLEVLAIFHPTIDQAIINVLNNAADASPKTVTIEVSWSREELKIAIDDLGGGIASDVANRLGYSPVSTKSRGLGIGVLLSNATFDRFGGTLKFTSKVDGGTRTEIELPLTLIS